MDTTTTTTIRKKRQLTSDVSSDEDSNPEATETQSSIVELSKSNFGPDDPLPSTFDLVIPSGPKKRFYRQRAHSAVLKNIAIGYPSTPSEVKWNLFYPKFNFNTSSLRSPSIVDLGCGYGGLLFPLCQLFPNSLILGIEIRKQTSSFVRDKIAAARKDYPGKFHNIAVMRSNAMKTWPNLFRKNSIEKLFICFPDPQFKRSNLRKRIVSAALLDQYAYSMKNGAIFYTITDVLDVANWIREHTDNHPSFERIPEKDHPNHIAIPPMLVDTEEGKKVTREQRPKYLTCWKVVKN